MEWFSQQSIDMSLWALDQNEILHSQPTQIAGSRHFWASGAEPQLPSRTSRRSDQRLYLLQTSNLTIPNSRELFHRHKAVFAPRGIVQRYQGRSFEKKEGRSIPKPRSAAACSSLPLLHHFAEVFEEVVRIVGAGAGFGVVLHAEQRQGAVAEAFEGVVVEVDVGEVDFSGVEGVGIDGEVVIVAGDLDLAGVVALYRDDCRRGGRT